MNTPTRPASASFALFAIDVAQQLRAVAHELSKESGIKSFCSSFAAELVNVQECLVEQLNEGGEPATHRVSKFLDNLEKLCQVSLPLTTKRFRARIIRLCSTVARYSRVYFKSPR
jgi:hypothetical protein